jgi:hypothetical protein
MFICEPIDRKAADGVAGAHYILNQVIITGPTGGAQEVINVAVVQSEPLLAQKC